jgi:sulfite dehydrogenase (cytochrome) subunit B
MKTLVIHCSLFALLAIAGTLGVTSARDKEIGSGKAIKLPDDNAAAKLKPGKGSDTTESNCATCHSTDYIIRQPGGDAKRWLEVVNKMAKVYGAPVSDEDARVIADYLGAAYAPAAAKQSQVVQTPSNASSRAAKSSSAPHDK